MKLVVLSVVMVFGVTGVIGSCSLATPGCVTMVREMSAEFGLATGGKTKAAVCSDANAHNDLLKACHGCKVVLDAMVTQMRSVLCVDDKGCNFKNRTAQCDIPGFSDKVHALEKKGQQIGKMTPEFKEELCKLVNDPHYDQQTQCLTSARKDVSECSADFVNIVLQAAGLPASQTGEKMFEESEKIIKETYALCSTGLRVTSSGIVMALVAFLYLLRV